MEAWWCVLVVCCVLVQGKVWGQISSSEYDVYVGERATPFIAYAAPEIDTAKATLEPRQIDRVDAPRALCGATVLTSDLLMTSVRCSPSVASKAVLYLLPRGSTSPILTQTQEARQVRGAVRNITLLPEYVRDNSTFTNVALVELNVGTFTSP